ncbi:MAG: nucleotidyltransferase substrate binding protein [Proteobacteria bacterium]|nr:nucleotidyltransferase substrate binding protein [Pseudomonadota bacterium]
MEDKAGELALHLAVLEQALETLDEALREPFSVIVRDATIQRFEYTFELAWKLLRKVSKIEGLETASPRQAIRAAFDVKLIEDADAWFEMLEARNRTSHTYDAATAEEVYESAARFPALLRQVIREVRPRYLPKDP